VKTSLVLLAFFLSLALPLEAGADIEAKVTARALKVKDENGKHVCSIPRGTKVIIKELPGLYARIPAVISVPGCPEVGHIWSEYLKYSGPADSGFVTVAEDEEEITDEAVEEAEEIAEEAGEEPVTEEVVAGDAEPFTGDRAPATEPFELPDEVPLPSHRPDIELSVLASALNIRTESGKALCVAKNSDLEAASGQRVEAVARHPDGQRIKVRTNIPGCAEGWVYSSFVEPKSVEGLGVVTGVGGEGLAYRSEPRAHSSTLQCRLSKKDKVRLLGEEKSSGEVTWVKVAVEPAKSGCPETGYVAKFYLDPPNFFTSLPESADGEDCAICNELAKENEESIFGWLGSIERDLSSDGSPTDPSDRVNRFLREMNDAAAQCRGYAPHVCKRRGRSHPCGRYCGAGRSKGWCKQAVREATEKALGFTLPGGSAISTKPTLERRMTKLSNVKSCGQAPVGAICLYSGGVGHNYGHIEVKTGRRRYCSDYCAANPIGTGRRYNRRFVGAYYP
jgi:hypothetical protein